MDLRAVFPVALLFCASAAYCQSPVPLRDGQQITLTGELTMEPAGRLQFVTVKTHSAYVPLFPGENRKETRGETLHEIGLSGYDYALAYAHRGQQVTVTGKLLTDEATPYFWHGTRLEAASLRTSDGDDLTGKSLARPGVPTDLTRYTSTAILHADLALPWTYQVKGKTITRGTYLTCSSNGGGDVVNCFCADGFHPVRAESSLLGGHRKGEILPDMTMAQFEAGDDATEVHLHVTCSR